MRGNRSEIFLCFFCIFLLSVVPASLARQRGTSEESGQESSPSQAHATMASLFSRGSKMPVLPKISGTLALPAFDSSGLKIDEDALSRAQQQGLETGDQRPKTRD